jgi:putative NADPH-quinone reductase
MGSRENSDRHHLRRKVRHGVMVKPAPAHKIPDTPLVGTATEISMNSYKIALVVGSLRKESLNRKLANALVKLAPTEFSFNELQIGNLPLYNQDDDENQADSVKRLKKEISAAQRLLFVTPEYNRSIPGVLKNALDNASRPYGQNAWAGKPAGIRRRFHWCRRHRIVPTASAQRSRIPGRTDTRPTHAPTNARHDLRPLRPTISSAGQNCSQFHWTSAERSFARRQATISTEQAYAWTMIEINFRSRAKDGQKEKLYAWSTYTFRGSNRG